MKFGVAISTMAGDTRDLLAGLARGNQLTLMPGDVDVLTAAESLRDCKRVWFEGVGALLEALCESDSFTWLSGALLRVGERDVDRLAQLGLLGRVSDVVLNSQRALAAASSALDPRIVLHVLDDNPLQQYLGRGRPDERLNSFRDLLLSGPGELPGWQYDALAELEPLCRGRVLMPDQPRPAALRYVRDVMGCEVSTNAEGPTPDAVLLTRPVRTPAQLAPLDGLAVGESTAVGAIVDSPHIAPTAAKAMVQSRLSGRSVDAGRHSVCAAVNADAALPAAEKNAQPPTSCEVEAEWPGVSAVVIVYNDQARVGRAIQSLQRQSYANIEIVVIDDGSTDQTQAVVQALAGEDRRIRYVRKPHSGRPQTRNVGVAEARHPWLAWLDSDDVAMPGRIARQMELAVAEPNIDILHTDGLFVGTAESTRRRRIYPDVGERFPAALLEGFADICPILNTSATIRRELYHAIGDYDADFPRCQDYDFYVRCAIAGRRRVRRVPLPLVRVELGATDNRAFYDTAIDAYARLAGKLLEGCSLTELQEQRSADLGEPPALAVARALLSLAALYKAAPEHWLLSKTFELLEQLPRGTEPKQRAIAANLAGVAHNYAGRPDQAVALYRQAVELWPGLKIAQDNLRALQSAAPAPAGNY